MSYKILVTEDDEFMADFLEISLTKIGYQPIGIAYTGLEAIEKCNEQLPDLVLMDIELPGELDGIRAADVIRKKHNIPVIYVTGNTDHKILKRALESNPNGYILKPINGEQLYPIIEMCMRRHKLEYQLRNLNEQLEEKVKDRTKELSSKNTILEHEIYKRRAIEEELKYSLAKEKELNELKSRVVTIVSHEFKTPLTTILSSAQLIEHHLKKQSTDKIKPHSETIIKSVNLLTQIINETLFLSKAESGRMEIKIQAFNPMSFLLNLIDDLRLGIGQNHQFHFYENEEHPLPHSFETDALLLKQILTNLLGNAIKYSPSNPDIKIKARYENNVLTIAIKDKGIGIPEEDQKYLFRMFNRASNTTNIEGTGIGLAIVKKCLDLLGGSIYIESKENIGSTFYVSLPNQTK